MSVTANELNEFHRFAEAVLARHEAESLHELVDIWESEQASPDLRAQNVAAVKAALRDMNSGDVGRPAAAVVNQLRSELAKRPSR
jgi:hypothetical protein